ncbi:hypothetical protein DA2_1273 [Desulfovibrio sp. A2]|nr:hypothetical protein DA2_1273 [Desulfovibrio sp. A2]
MACWLATKKERDLPGYHPRASNSRKYSTYRNSAIPCRARHGMQHHRNRVQQAQHGAQKLT